MTPAVTRETLLRAQSGPICTSEVMLHSPRVNMRRYRRGLNFAPTDPSFIDALAGQPARAGPDSLGVAPDVMGSARPAHWPAAHRVAAELRPLSPPSPATRVRAVACDGPARGPGPALPAQSDSDDSDAPACCPCWPEPVFGGRPDPD